MSDSDDTEILLLIPPNFFFADPNADDELNGDFRSLQVGEHSNCTALMSGQSELDSINARLSQIEKNFSTNSDISTISNCTVRTLDSRKPLACNSPPRLCHSTPKCAEPTLTNFDAPVPKDGNSEILHEIDKFLHKKNDFSNPADTRASNWVLQQSSDKQLISLDDIWGPNGNDENFAMQEERLRRQHCERTIQALQSKLLEYQQKLTVAIQVDKKKDLALQKLSGDFQTLGDRMAGQIKNLDSENETLKTRKDFLEKELTHALNSANQLQEKHQTLEAKASSLMRSSEESGKIYKKQVEDLEIRLSNSQHNEGRVKEELTRLRSELGAAQLLVQKDTLINKQLELCQGELELTKKQKTDFIVKLKEERNRSTALRNEQQVLSNNLSELKQKEINILRELETQRISLKSYYQQQLEQVVSQKLTEFQSQLDIVEENLRTEGKNREKLLAERAIKQIEMINVKNEQEISLLQEKHNEEVELYRIQLTNASKTIDDLREKLNLYKSKRSDIASKLHNIMECQWQKALEVLTSPNTAEKPNEINPHNLNLHKLDGVRETTQDNAENELFETPTSSRSKKLKDKATEEKLQAYIQLLLNKSPRDLDKLDELLRQPNRQDCELESMQKSRRDQKPPWK